MTNRVEGFLKVDICNGNRVAVRDSTCPVKTRQDNGEKRMQAVSGASISVSLLYTRLIIKLNFNITF